MLKNKINFVTYRICMRHTGMTDFDDIYYIRKVKGGQPNAFAFIVRRYQKMVYTIVGKIVSTSTDAEDITQEVFIKIFQSLHKFREESEFATWLYRIAYNTTISELRKRKYKFTAYEDNFVNIPDEDISDSIYEINTHQKLNYLDQVLKMLSPADALLITMFYLNDHSIQEISEITGYSSTNIKVKLHRIRKIMNFEINKLMQS